jgi:hypothetical protein
MKAQQMDIVCVPLAKNAKKSLASVRRLYHLSVLRKGVGDLSLIGVIFVLAFVKIVVKILVSVPVNIAANFPVILPAYIFAGLAE